MSGILFISSDNTGNGHKSITKSIREQIANISPCTNIEEIDGFMLSGSALKNLSNLYNFVATNFPKFWGFCYKVGNICPSFINFLSKRSIRKKFLEIIERINPDVIISVHPGFIGATLDILEEKNISIPFISFIADLDNVSHLWADKRSYCTICPTQEAMDSMLKLGISSDRLKLTGFPVREKFNKLKVLPKPAENVWKKEKKTFLIMNGSQGAKHVTKIGEILLKNYDCNIIIIAGNNQLLRKSCETGLVSQYGERVSILGFVENVEYYMQMSDVLILRASPNVLTESINLCKPIIISGAFTGQEEKNPEYVAKNGLGVVCSNIKELPEVVDSLFAEEGKKLTEIFNNQIRYRKPEASKEIAEYLIDIINGDVRGSSIERIS